MSSQPPNEGWGPPPHHEPPPRQGGGPPTHPWGAPAPPGPPGAPRPWYRQRWFIVVAALVGLFVFVGVIASLASPTTPKKTTPTTAAVVAAPTSEVTLPPTTTMPPTTVPPTTARPTTTHPATTAAPATHPPTTRPPTTKPPAKNCDPAYPDTCLHDGIGDYDCAGGSGNGPNYVEGPIRVLQPDPFGLDSDHDGIGCER
jgi:hypothetical protein